MSLNGQRLAVVGKVGPSGSDAADVYELQLTANQSASFVLGDESKEAALSLELLDASGQLQALGAATSDTASYIADFVPDSDGTYYARVAASDSVSCVLTVVQNAAFDVEPNDEFETSDAFAAAAAVSQAGQHSLPTEGAGQFAARVWQNPSQPEDVNDDGFVVPIDALIIINELNSGGTLAPSVDSLGLHGLVVSAAVAY